MTSLMGGGIRVIDTKNRLTIPVKWRKLIGSEVIIHLSSDHIKLWDSEAFPKQIDLSKCEALTVDSQGRILLPSQWIGDLNLTRTVVFAGKGDHLEIYK